MTIEFRWVAFLGLALICLYSFNVAINGNYFWDMAVYQGAVDTHLSGGNAYADLEGLKFVYPPIILHVMAFWGAWLSWLVFGVILLSLLCFLHAGMQVLFWGLVVSSVIFFSPQVSQVYGFQSGNITAPFHVFVVFALLRTNRGENLLPFFLVVAAVSLIKPYFLAYLAVPFFFRGFSARLFLAASVVAVVTIAGFALQYVVMPETFGQFISALQAQVIGEPASKGAGRDVGKGLYYYLGSIPGVSRLSALLLHFAILLPLVAVVFLVARTVARTIVNDRFRFEFLVLIGVVVAIVLNPRLKVYDWFIMDAAAVGAAIILVKARLRSIQAEFWWLLMAAMLVTCLVGQFMEAGWIKEFSAALPVYLPLVVLAADLMRASRPAPEPSQSKHERV